MTGVTVWPPAARAGPKLMVSWSAVHSPGDAASAVSLDAVGVGVGAAGGGGVVMDGDAGETGFVVELVSCTVLGPLGPLGPLELLDVLVVLVAVPAAAAGESA